jgi:hypothetical protein
MYFRKKLTLVFIKMETWNIKFGPSSNSLALCFLLESKQRTTIST